MGVWKAKTFEPVRAARKVAMDLVYPEGVVERWEEAPGVEMHEVKSDAYFGSIVGDGLFDVIYLDGLHRFEQTLRDFLNALPFIKSDGITINDVHPDTYHGSLPDREHATQVKAATKSGSRNWMGDISRVTFFIDTFMQHFSNRVVSNNHGQLVIWRTRWAPLHEIVAEPAPGAAEIDTARSLEHNARRVRPGVSRTGPDPERSQHGGWDSGQACNQSEPDRRVARLDSKGDVSK